MTQHRGSDPGVGGLPAEPAMAEARASGEEILVAEGLRKVFGGLMAVRAYDLRLRAGEILGLIGPNGAGKTTVINMMSGLEPPTNGRVRFGGHSIGRWPAQRIARLGLARTFQNLRLFGDYSARDNVVTALLSRPHYGIIDALLPGARFHRATRRLHEEAEALLRRVGLAGDGDVPAGSLPYGKQRRLEVARALALEPSLLLLDEPAAGMVEEEQRDLSELLRTLRAEGLTLLIVDHNIRFLLSVVDRVQVMNHGELIAQGKPGAVVADPLVVEAYLGSDLPTGAA